MATIYRFGVELNGWTGGPGRNTWYMAQAGAVGGADPSDLEAIAGDIHTVYDTLKPFLVSGVTVTLRPIVEELDVATGNLLSAQPITPPATVTGSSTTTSLSRATQATVRLRTDAIRRNRVLQGRHFIGPIGTTLFGTDGLISSSSATAVQNAYGGVLDVAGNARLVVWGQPNPAVAGLATGTFGYVQSAVCNRVPGTLRSRKV